MGGRAGSYSSSKNEVYDPVTDTWVSKSSMRRTRTGLDAGVIGNKIYATGGHQGPPIEILSSIEQYNPELTEVDNESNLSSGPKHFILYPNYPNPFTSTTTIQYFLNKSNFVNLEIFNVKGERIVTAVNEFKNGGNYSLVLNTSQFSSGIYFYKMQFGNQVSETRQMLHLK